MINRFYRRTPYDIGLYTPPVDTVYKTVEFLQKRYDFNRALVDQLKTTYINALPQDKAKAAMIQKSWNDAIDSLVKDSGGNFANISKGLNELTSTIRSQLAPTGEAGAIVNNFNLYQDWLKRHQDRVTKGEIIGADLAQASNYFLSNFGGTNPDEAGVYAQIQLDDLSNYVPLDEMSRKIANEVKPIKGKRGTHVLKDGLFIYNSIESEGVSKERIQEAVGTTLAGDARVMSYLRDKLKYAGGDPSKVSEFLSSYAGSLGEALAYENEFTDQKLTRDPMAVARYRVQAQKKNNEELMRNFMQLQEGSLLGVPTENGKIPLANPQGVFGRDIFDIASGQPEVPILQSPYRQALKMGANMFGPLGAIVSGGLDVQAYRTPTDKKASIIEIVNDPTYRERLTNKGYNVALLTEISKDLDAQIDRKKYINDKAYQKQVDQQIMDQYDKSIIPMSSSRSWNYRIPNRKMQEQIAKSELPKLLSGQGEFYIPGEDRVVAGNNIPSDIRKLLVDDKGNYNLNMINVEQVGPQSGYPYAGYKFNIGSTEGHGKSIVIPIRNVDVQKRSQEIYNAYGPLWEGKATVGNPYVHDMGVNPKTGQREQMVAIPSIDYVYNPTEGRYVESMKLYPMTKEGTRDMTQYMPYSTAELQRNFAPTLSLSGMYGVNKADMTQDPYMNVLFGTMFSTNNEDANSAYEDEEIGLTIDNIQ